MIALAVSSIAAIVSLGLAASTGAAAVRTVVIQTDSPSNANYSSQARALLDSADGLRERDMIVLSIIGTETAKVLVGPERQPRQQLPPAPNDPSRTGFYVTLIGKDGLQKFGSDKPVDPQLLFSLVDSMPMRRKEMLQTRTSSDAVHRVHHAFQPGHQSTFDRD